MKDKIGPVSGTNQVKDAKYGVGAENELRALISLLSDNDRKIVAMVRENLIRFGEVSLPFLQESAEHTDPRVRLRARSIVSEIRNDQLEKHYVHLARMDDKEFDFELALSVVAMIEFPDLEPAQVTYLLDELTEDIKTQIPSDLSPRMRIELLNQYLFKTLGFKGNTRDYYEPDNSFIHQVIKRKVGIPISLSALLILLGKRFDLDLHGVGLPKHFVVKYDGGEGEEIFIDPFNSGRLFNRQECMQMLTSDGYYFRESFAAEYLAISSHRDIIIRMLRGLVLIYSKLRDKNRVKQLSRYVEVLRTRERTR